MVWNHPSTLHNWCDITQHCAFVNFEVSSTVQHQHQAGCKTMNLLEQILQQAWSCTFLWAGNLDAAAMGGSQGTVMDKLCLAAKHLCPLTPGPLFNLVNP